MGGRSEWARWIRGEDRGQRISKGAPLGAATAGHVIAERGQHALLE